MQVLKHDLADAYGRGAERAAAVDGAVGERERARAAGGSRGVTCSDPRAPRRTRAGRRRSCAIDAARRASRPAHGELRLFEKPFAGSYVQRRSGSTITTSADRARPRASRPARRRMRAGFVDSAPHQLERRELALAHEIEHHGDGGLEADHAGRRLARSRAPSRARACGAWSVAIASIVPSASPARHASRSSAERSGGAIFAFVS